MARDVFRHILVPHDFSEPAAAALRTAAQLARPHGGKLTVLHVIVLSSLPADVPFGMPLPEDLIFSSAHVSSGWSGRRWAAMGHRSLCASNSATRPRGSSMPPEVTIASSWPPPVAPGSRISSSAASRRGSSVTPPCGAHPARAAAQAQAGAWSRVTGSPSGTIRRGGARGSIPSKRYATSDGVRWHGAC